MSLFPMLRRRGDSEHRSNNSTSQHEGEQEGVMIDDNDENDITTSGERHQLSREGASLPGFNEAISSPSTRGRTASSSSGLGIELQYNSSNRNNNNNGGNESNRTRGRREPSSLRSSLQSINTQQSKSSNKQHPPLSARGCQTNDDCLRVYAVIPRLFSVIAFALSLTVLIDCRLIRLQKTLVATNNDTSSTTDAFGAQATFYFGLYQYASPVQVVLPNGSTYLVYDMLNHQTPSWMNVTQNFTSNLTIQPTPSSCVRYPSDGSYQLSSDQVAARTFAIITCVLGGLMVTVLWFKCCCGFLCSYACPDLLVSLILLVLLPIVQGLAMVFDDQVCHFHPLGLDQALQQAGYTIDINTQECGVDRRGLYYPFSIVLWMICGILFTFIKPKTEDDLPYFQ